jgi:hypothetical protein
MKNNLAVIESDSVIVSMTRASLALAEAVTVGQTKTLIDVAYAAEIYSKRHHLSDEAIGRALSVKVDATRKLGEILRATPKNTGVKGSAVPNRNRANLDATPTLEELGLSKKESAVAQKLADLPEDQFEQVRLGNVTIAKAIAAVDAKPKTAPVAANAPQIAVPPLALVEDEYTELDAAHDQIEDLQAALVVANMGSTDSEEAAQAANLIADLRAHIKTLEATLKAVTISRDTFQNQVAEMQRQINRQRREIDRATGTRTA